jgi:hypothetical protein
VVLGILVVAAIVAVAIGIGSLFRGVVAPAISYETACIDALDAVSADDLPPTSAQARSTLPALEDARDQAQDAVDEFAPLGRADVLVPIEQLIAGYEDFAEPLPPSPDAGDEAAREDARTTIERAQQRLDSFCGSSPEQRDGSSSVGVRR